MSPAARWRCEHAIAGAVIIAAALVVFAPALARREVFTFRDHADYFTPMRLFTTMHLRAGRLPLWNPYSGSGEQWLANPQTGVFYPPAWLFSLLPFATAYVLYLFLHSLILGSGAYALFRRSAGTAAALAGSTALMFSGPVLSLLDVQNNFTTFAWVPWIIWSGHRDRERGIGVPRLSALLLALAFLAGEPFYAALAAVLYAAVVRRPRPVAVAAAGAAGLCAIQLLPFVDMLIGSDRFGGFVGTDILRDSMQGGDWLRCVAPARLLSMHAQSEKFIPVLYAGILVVLLAVVGVVAMIRARQYLRLASWALLAMSTAVIASGPEWVASIPLTLFRYPSRCMPFVMLAVAAFAAAGWERLRRGSAVVDAALIAAIVTDLVIAAHPLLASAPFGGKRLAYPASIGQSQKILQIYGAEPLRSGARAAWLSGYLNLLDRRFEASTAAPLAPRAYTSMWTAAQSDFRLLRMMGVGYVLVPWGMPPPFALVARVGEVRTYRVPGSLPMAYVRFADGKIAAPQALSLDASRALVRVSTPTGGLLVLTQNHVRGWHVSVDGRAAHEKIYMGTFRAVDVPPGSHGITWIYRPASLEFGALLTAVALLWLAFGVRRLRAASEPRA